MNGLMKKVFLAFGVLIFLTATTAITLVVKSELEASGLIGTSVPIVFEGTCQISDISKVIRSVGDLSDENNKYVISYSLIYSVDGKKDFITQQLKTADISTENLEKIVKIDCENLKKKIELEMGRVDTVIIRPDNEIYNKLYDLATGKWEKKE